MKTNQFRPLLFAVILFLTACASTVVEKTSETMSRGVYATGAALQVGNFPAAAQFNAGVEALTPKPKKFISVPPLTLDGNPVVLLQEEFKNDKLVFVGSSDYTALQKNKQFDDELNQATQYVTKESPAQAAVNTASTNAVILENSSLKQQLLDWHKSIFFKAYVFCQSAFWLTVVVAIGLVVACVAFPAIMPVVGTVLGTIFRVAVSLFGDIVSGAGWLAGKLTKSSTTPTT
jgi:hypothetical protein